MRKQFAILTISLLVLSTVTSVRLRGYVQDNNNLKGGNSYAQSYSKAYQQDGKTSYQQDTGKDCSQNTGKSAQQSYQQDNGKTSYQQDNGKVDECQQDNGKVTSKGNQCQDIGKVSSKGDQCQQDTGKSYQQDNGKVASKGDQCQQDTGKSYQQDNGKISYQQDNCKTAQQDCSQDTGKTSYQQDNGKTDSCQQDNGKAAQQVSDNCQQDSGKTTVQQDSGKTYQDNVKTSQQLNQNDCKMDDSGDCNNDNCDSKDCNNDCIKDNNNWDNIATKGGKTSAVQSVSKWNAQQNIVHSNIVQNHHIRLIRAPAHRQAAVRILHTRQH
jgi:hypothetical protein